VPKVLASRGWTIDVASRGGTAFSLAPGAAKRVTLSATRGDEVTASDVAGEAERDVVVRVSGNGILLGGMTYRLDPSRVEAPRPDEGSGVVDGPVDGWRDAAQNLLQSLRLPADRAVGVRLRRVGLDIEIDEG